MINFNAPKKIFFVLLILSAITANAQVVNFGLEGGFNITEPFFIYPSDSSQLINASSSNNNYSTGNGTSNAPTLKSHPSYNPFFGFFGGIFVKYQPDKLANGWKFYAEIERRAFKTSLTSYYDPTINQVVMPTVRDPYYNTYINTGVLYVIQQSEKFEIGVGLCNHYLIKSLYVNPYGGNSIYGEIKNNQFKPDMLSLPLQGTYNFGNAFTYATIDIPVMSSARFGTTNYKCFQTVLQIGIGAYIRIVDR